MSETSETTKPAANEFGRCGSEVRDVMAAAMQNHCLDLDVMNWQHSILADAIDRLAADVAEIKEATLPQTTEERDCAIRERDEARALLEVVQVQRAAAYVDRDKSRAEAFVLKCSKTDAIKQRDEARAEVERLRAELAARPPATGWLTAEGKAQLSAIADALSAVGLPGGAEQARALLARAGSPPVVKVPVLDEWTAPARLEALAYRAALDAAGIPWKEKEVPRE